MPGDLHDVATHPAIALAEAAALVGVAAQPDESLHASGGQLVHLLPVGTAVDQVEPESQNSAEARRQQVASVDAPHGVGGLALYLGPVLAPVAARRQPCSAEQHGEPEA